MEDHRDRFRLNLTTGCNGKCSCRVLLRVLFGQDTTNRQGLSLNHGEAGRSARRGQPGAPLGECREGVLRGKARPVRGCQRIAADDPELAARAPPLARKRTSFISDRLSSKTRPCPGVRTIVVRLTVRR